MLGSKRHTNLTGVLGDKPENSDKDEEEEMDSSGKKRITLSVNTAVKHKMPQQQEYKLARFAKCGPPSLSPEVKVQQEKGFILDAVAVSTLSDDSGRANPKMATAIPPYNAQKDRHSKGYFEKPVVKKLLKQTEQEPPGDSISGKQMDKFYGKGMMGTYIKLRNSAGAGHSKNQVGGHGLFMENIPPLNGYHGSFGFRRNTPSLRQFPSVFTGKIDSRSLVP